MNIEEAVVTVLLGKKVKLPEWTGYWFRDEDGKTVKVLTKDGEILDSPWIEKYKDRDDFFIMEEGLGFDFAIRALKNWKSVRREIWDQHIRLREDGAAIVRYDEKNNSIGIWNPTTYDLVADDWVLYLD